MHSNLFSVWLLVVLLLLKNDLGRCSVRLMRNLTTPMPLAVAMIIALGASLWRRSFRVRTVVSLDVSLCIIYVVLMLDRMLCCSISLNDLLGVHL